MTEPRRRLLVRNLLLAGTVMAAEMTKELRYYFEYSNAGVEVVEDGLVEMNFGEFLVENRIIDRYQLLCALQMQDANPGVRLGECIAALGYLPYPEVEQHVESWRRVAIIEA